MSEPEFRLLPIELLQEHEEVVPTEVAQLVRALRVAGVVTEPIWVARGTMVILNGHHRFQALRELGARVVPAWVMEYEDAAIELDRWGEGPALTKAEVVERARAKRPYPPKTTRHRVAHALPPHPTTLEELGVPADLPGGRRSGASAR